MQQSISDFLHKSCGNLFAIAFDTVNPPALGLIDKSLKRGSRPGIVLIDSSYGNNTSFLKKLEEKKLKYIGGIARKSQYFN